MENNSNIYLKKFKVAIGVVAAGIILLIFFITKIIPAVQNVVQIGEEFKAQTMALEDAERKLQSLKDEEKKEQEEETSAPKAVFRPITSGLDTEAAISDEFGEILQLIRENKIKARSVVYDYDPKDDKFVKNAASKYHVCRVTTELVANYTQLENFLRDLYKHEHFLEISKIEISPYQKNKRILLIKLVLCLYAQRDGSPVEEVSAPAAENSEQSAEQGSSEQKPEQKSAPTEELHPDDM